MVREPSILDGDERCRILVFAEEQVLFLLLGIARIKLPETIRANRMAKFGF